MTLTKIGASLGGGADTIFVTQAGHGLTLGYPVKASGNGTYAHATADTAANAEAIGIIIESTTDTMLIALSGRITVDGCIPNLSAGTVLFLQVSAGLLAAAEPSGNTQVSKPMAVITYANSEMILLAHRGEVISTAGVVSAPIDVNYLVGTANSTLSAEIVVGTAPGGELGNTWASPTVDGTHSGSAHHAASHTVASHSDTTGTGAELETLTDGSNAESLHTHTHTVVSHSDTTATGAELETLTDGSTTALHAHAGADISARVTHSTTQSISSDGWVTLVFNTDRFDTEGSANSGDIHNTSSNTSRLTCRTAGKYLIMGNVEWSAHATGERVIRILFGGSTEIGKTGSSSVSNVTHAQNVVTLFNLAVGEYVELSAYQTSGTSLNINDAGSYTPEFMMTKVG